MGITLTQYRISIGTFCGKGASDDLLSFPRDTGRSFWGISTHYCLSDWGLWTRRQWSQHLYNQQRNVFYKSSRSLVQGMVGLSLFIHIGIVLLCSGDIHPNPGPVVLNDINISHSNIRSLRNYSERLDDIRCSLTNQFNIITLSETWLNNSIDTKCLHLNDFQPPYRRDRPDNSGYGGLLVWVSQQLAAKRRTNLEIAEIEGLWLEIRAHNNKFLLGTFYRPPNSGATFWDYLQESIDNAKLDPIKNIIITGDFNADPATPAGRLLQDFVEVNHLRLHITEPTRYGNNSNSILDQFISNIPDYIRRVDVLPPLANSDHCTISVKLKFKLQKLPAYSRVMWDFKNADFKLFRESLQECDFTFCDNILDVNATTEQWTSTFLAKCKNIIPQGGTCEAK